jgi:hypothetical protein
MSPTTAQRRTRVRALLVLLALAAVALPWTAPPGAQARPLITGIAGIGDYQPLAFERTRAAGAGLVRLSVPWSLVAPMNRPAAWDPESPADPHYDWDYIDTGVHNAVAAGLVPMLLIDGAPQWAQRCLSPPGLQHGNLCDPDPAALAQFATAIARRYSGNFGGLPRVQYWQGLNEPNLTIFFFPQFNTAGRSLSPDLYRNLINSFSAAIKAVDPANRVIAAGLGPTELKNYNIGPMKFTRELLCMKGKTNPKPIKGKCKGGVHFDIFDIHPYTTGSPTHEGRVNDVQLGDLGKLQTLLHAADKAGRIKGAFKKTPLWITEFGWDSNPPDPGGLPPKILNQWTAEAMHRAWSAGVSRFFWYTLRDEPFEASRPSSETVQSGLYFRDGVMANDQPKPVLNTFHFPFVAYSIEGEGLEVWGRTTTSAAGKVQIQALRGGKWRGLGVLRADRRGIFKGVLSSGYGANKRGAVRASFHGHPSNPFPMRRVPDFFQPPFG